MKVNIMKLVWVMSVMIMISAPQSGFAYGGGGGGGGAGGDGGGGDITNDSFGGGAWGVSWAPNPNGSDVIGSSIWHGRPENVRQGPYQPNTAVEDAEAELLSGYQSGTYTAEEVKAHLEWAQRVGIKISNQARQTLKNILKSASKPNIPSTTSITTPGSISNTTPSSSSKLSDEDMNSIALTLDFLTIYNKIKADKKKLGLKPNAFDVIAAALKSGVVTVLDD